MTGTSAKTSPMVEIVNITPRRRWSVAEKIRMIEASMAEGQFISQVARACGVAPNLLYRWRKHRSDGDKTAIEANDEVVSVAEVNAHKKQIRPLERVLGNKTLEVEILKEAVRIGSEKNLSRGYHYTAWGISSENGHRSLAVSRANTYKHSRSPRPRPERYSKAEDAYLPSLMIDVLARHQTYGYRRIQRLLNRQLITSGHTPVNHKRVYRIMSQNNLLLARLLAADQVKRIQAALPQCRGISAGTKTA